MKFFALIFVLLLSASALAQTNTFQSQCYLPGEKIATQGLNSTTFSISTYPRCQVDVYFTGTTTHAPISLGNSSGTGGANPFTANTDASWLFWAADGIGYDVKMTGGSPYVMPRTKTLVDLINASGGAPPVSGCGSVIGDNSSTTCGFGNRTGDTATTPANVQVYGYTNLTNNSGQNIVAIGTSVATGNFASDVIAIGNNAYSNPISTGGSDVIAIGDNALINGAGVDQTVAIGNHVLEGVNGEDNVSIGDHDSLFNTGFNNTVVGLFNAMGVVGHSCDTNDLTAIGNGNANDCQGQDLQNVVAVGLGNVAQRTGLSTSQWQEVVAVGDTNAGNKLGYATPVSSFTAVVAIGLNTASNLTDATDIVAIGDNALCCVNVDGVVNNQDVVAIGDGAASGLKTGSFNVVAIGIAPLNASGGNELIGIGDSVANNSTGHDIIALGDDSLGGVYAHNTGNDLIVVGNHACAENSTGHDNICIGDYAGSIGWTQNSGQGNSNNTGINNIWIGNNAGPNTATQLSNTIGIGFQAFNTASNQVVIGNASITSLKLFGCPSGQAVLDDGSGTCFSPSAGGTTSINTVAGPAVFTFSAGAGSCSGSNPITCNITGSSTGAGSVTVFTAPGGSWPTWLVPTVANGATTPQLTVAASAIPNAALANSAITIGSTSVSLGATASSISGLTLVAPALGTPTALVLTNATSLPLTGLTTQGANTLVANITAGTAVPTAVSIPTCNTAGSSALIYTPVTGFTCNTISGGGGAVSSVSNSDGTLTISPTTGAVVASLALGHANTWSGTQTFVAPVLGTPASVNLTNATAIPAAAITGNLGNTHLAVQVANTVLGALTATTPSGLAMPSCSGAANGLIWTTSTGFGCNTFSSTGNTTSTALTTGTIPFANGANSIVDSHLSDTGTQLVYAGTGANHGLSLAEGGTIAGAGGSDILYTNSSLHRWMQNPNNTGALIVPGVSTAIAAGNVWVAASNGIDLIDGGPQFPVAAQTIVNCATSGTVTYSQPSTNASYKVVMAYAAACLGAASYTFPTAFVHSPQILSQSLTGIVSASSTTAVTVTGTTSTGFIELNGY